MLADISCIPKKHAKSFTNTFRNSPNMNIYAAAFLYRESGWDHGL